MSTDNGLVLPDLSDPQTQPYWAAAQQRQLHMQICTNCRFLRWPPGDTCPSCLSREAEWTPLRGTGKIYSYCVYHRALNPAFPDVPYTIVMVELAEGPIVIGRLLNSPAKFAIGSEVQSAFTDITEDVTLVNFTLTPPRKW